MLPFAVVRSSSSSPATPERAWVRAPTEAFADCLRMHEEEGPRVDRAQTEHEGYVTALRAAGVQVEIISPAPGLPDACFVEDVAVILDHRAVVMTRPGAPARQREGAEVASRIAGRFEHVWSMQSPGTLDGGDVMRMGSHLYVGRSRRTNAEGIDQLRAFGERLDLTVQEIPVARGLHLKSACTALDAHTVVVDPRALDPAVLQAEGLTTHAVPEPLGANVLTFGDRILVSAAAPRTAQWLESQGHTVVRIAVGEFHRGDGALSCLSLRQPPPADWSV